MFTILILLLGLPFALLFLSVNLYRRPNAFDDCILLFILTMAMFAYLVVPSERMDLYRYFESLDYCKNIPFKDAADWSGDGLVVKNYLFWLIAQTGNKHILPALSTGALYGVLVSITCKTCKSSVSMPLILTIQLLSMPYLEAVSNVRNMLAFSISIFAVYRDIYKKKLDIVTIACYLLSTFIHISGATILICRLVALLYSKFPKLGLLSTLLLPIIVLRSNELLTAVSSLVPGSAGKVLSRAVFKAYTSTTNASVYAQTRLESGYFNYSRFICLGIILVVIYCEIREISIGQESNRGITSVSLVLSSITAVWIINGTVKYWVYFVASLLTCGPSLVGEFDRARQHINERIPTWLLSTYLLGLCCCRFILEIYYIDQCLVFHEYLKDILTTNIITYIVGLL